MTTTAQTQIINSAVKLLRNSKRVVDIAKKIGVTKIEKSPEEGPVAAPLKTQDQIPEKKAGQKTVAIDFDDTIHKSPGSPHAPLGKPVEGAKEALRKLKDAGYQIIIFTVRDEPVKIKRWLRQHGIPFDHINHNPHQPPGTSGKVIAHHYIDDRAVEFKGNWKETVDRLLGGIPHWRDQEAKGK